MVFAEGNHSSCVAHRTEKDSPARGRAKTGCCGRETAGILNLKTSYLNASFFYVVRDSRTIKIISVKVCLCLCVCVCVSVYVLSPRSALRFGRKKEKPTQRRSPSSLQEGGQHCLLAGKKSIVCTAIPNVCLSLFLCGVSFYLSTE